VTHPRTDAPPSITVRAIDQLDAWFESPTLDLLASGALVVGQLLVGEVLLSEVLGEPLQPLGEPARPRRRIRRRSSRP
jgi:hypothetical protein